MKIGDYVRVLVFDGSQKVIKIEKIIDDYTVLSDSGYWTINEFVKVSPNMIGIIEIGDYVNGMKVKAINYKAGLVIVDTLSDENTIFNYGIKSVLTREQFLFHEYIEGEYDDL